MLDASIIQALQNIVGEKHVLTRKVDLVTYSFDATADVPRQIPDVVVLPENAQEIRSIENLTATVQPGVVIQELNNAVTVHGLLYPPDPGTVATATMGGSVAENSGGLRGLKYGVTKHYVMGMQVVLANGDQVKFGGKTVKNVTAYEFSSLFVGSEGTLGIITEITVKLIPAPKFRRTMLATFRTIEDAGNTVAGIIK